ncbi:uncharacterized protein LOC129271594 [Lytechinus pictus]|uniref:uncharacterized protein LOC129271594 n=1 Tax=Lytechinus pictus TaxID=7653 RepID=UPI0030B9FB8C
MAVAREPEEGTWEEPPYDSEGYLSSVKTLTSQELSLALPLKGGGSPIAFSRGTSDEGLPLSPESLEPHTPRGDLLADIQRLEGRLRDILGVLASLAHLTEGTRTEQRCLSERFDEMLLERIDMKKKYRELAYMVERLEDRLKTEEEKQNFDDKMAKEVEAKVKEELDKRQSEFLAEMEGKVKTMILQEQAKKEEREVHLCIRQQRFTEEMAGERVEEVKKAMVEAHKERGEVMKKFRVTKVKLQEEQRKNAHLLQKIEELELRCKHLEEENSRLRLSDIVHQTHFTFEGPKLECFSCRNEYSTHHNDAEGCRFHPIPSMPFESWRNCIPAEDLPANFPVSHRSRYHFWACCNILATRRPEGCCHGRHHQQWEMDILMRQVLVEGSEHSAFTEPLRVQ